MLVATEWLREAVLRQHEDADSSLKERGLDWAELLTMLGLETEWVNAPQADGLTLARIVGQEGGMCTLDHGGGTAQAKAPEKALGVGSVVAYCKDSGSIVTSGRGLESDWLKFSREDEEGVGQGVLGWLGLDQDRLEVSPTPDRGDCLSIAGLAREAGAALGRCHPGIAPRPPVKEEISDSISVRLNSGTATARYCGRFVRGVNIHAPTPRWMRNRLLAAGMGSSYCVVDVTNYVMLELGQPLHAFDAARISGGITVRWAGAGERMELLDGRSLSLRPDCLLIADRKGPLALAGIMGGAGSAISDSTRDIFLESALFLPEAISGRPMRYDLHTDSSHRFERQVDSAIQEEALQAATALIMEIAGGAAGPVCGAARRRLLPKPRKVKMHHGRLERVMGDKFSHGLAESSLGLLNMRPARRGQVYTVEVPSYRNDIENDDDLVAEVLRLHGYDKISPRPPESPMIGCKTNVMQEVTEILSDSLVALGYQEIRSSTFRPAGPGPLPDPAPTAKVSNPMSENQEAMRTSLWPGLVSCLNYNLNRGQELLRLFEVGTVFHEAGENCCMAGLSNGIMYKNQWNSKERLTDFYDMKSDLQNMFAKWGHAADFAESAQPSPALHPGCCADILLDGERIGVVGELHPVVAKDAAEADAPVYLFEFTIENIKLPKASRCLPAPRHPGMRRDLSLAVPDGVRAGDVTGHISSLFQNREDLADIVLEQASVFDVFYADNNPGSGKNIAIRLIYRKKGATMSDQEADFATELAAAAVAESFGAVRR